MIALNGADTEQLPKLPPAAEPDSQWRQTARTISNFLAQLPEYISSFFFRYQQQLLTIVLILSALVTVKVVLALLDAINSIPLLSPIFELVGLGYATWFSFRYLLKAATRQELADKIRSFKQETVGEIS